MAYKYDEQGKIIDFNYGDVVADKMLRHFQSDDCKVDFFTRPAKDKEGNLIPGRMESVYIVVSTYPCDER